MIFFSLQKFRLVGVPSPSPKLHPPLSCWRQVHKETPDVRVDCNLCEKVGVLSRENVTFTSVQPNTCPSTAGVHTAKRGASSEIIATGKEKQLLSSFHLTKFAIQSASATPCFSCSIPLTHTHTSDGW